MSVTLCTVESGTNVSKAGQRDIALKSGTVPRKTGRLVGMRLTQAHCLCFKMVLRSIGIAHQCKALQQIGLDVANYSGHSFRIGAAPT